MGGVRSRKRTPSNFYQASSYLESRATKKAMRQETVSHKDQQEWQVSKYLCISYFRIN